MTGVQTCALPIFLAVADNIETMKVIVQSGSGVAIVPRPCAHNEVALGVLKALSIMPSRSVALSLFRRRQPLSRRKEGYLAALQKALQDQGRYRFLR